MLKNTHKKHIKLKTPPFCYIINIIEPWNIGQQNANCIEHVILNGFELLS